MFLMFRRTQRFEETQFGMTPNLFLQPVIRAEGSVEVGDCHIIKRIVFVFFLCMDSGTDRQEAKK
jgi:hypothetical protein